MSPVAAGSASGSTAIVAASRPRRPSSRTSSSPCGVTCRSAPLSYRRLKTGASWCTYLRLAVDLRAHEQQRRRRSVPPTATSSATVVRSRQPNRRRASSGSVGPYSGRTSGSAAEHHGGQSPSRVDSAAARQGGQTPAAIAGRRRSRAAPTSAGPRGTPRTRACATGAPRMRRRWRPARSPRRPASRPRAGARAARGTAARARPRPARGRRAGPRMPCSAVTVSGIVCDAAATFSELTRSRSRYTSA